MRKDDPAFSVLLFDKIVNDTFLVAFTNKIIRDEIFLVAQMDAL